jgi:hypothetical protein
MGTRWFGVEKRWMFSYWQSLNSQINPFSWNAGDHPFAVNGDGAWRRMGTRWRGVEKRWMFSYWQSLNSQINPFGWNAGDHPFAVNGDGAWRRMGTRWRGVGTLGGDRQSVPLRSGDSLNGAAVSGRGSSPGQTNGSVFNVNHGAGRHGGSAGQGGARMWIGGTGPTQPPVQAGNSQRKAILL